MSTTVAPIQTTDPLTAVTTSSIVGVTTLKNQINTIQTSLSSLQSQLSSDEPTSLVNTITDLQTRVTELENIMVAVLNN